MELPVQALRTTSMELGISNRTYIGNATLYSRLGFQWGIGALGAQPEHKASVAMGGPTSRYHMWLVNHLLWAIDRHPLPLHSMDNGYKAVREYIV